MKNKNLKNFLLALILLFLLIINIKIVSAETNEKKPKIIISWQAINFYPIEYEGKANPTINSPLLIKAQLIKNNKIIKNTNLYFKWEINLKNFQEGYELDQIILTPKDKIINENYILLKITIEDKINQEKISEIFQINLKNPILVIQNSYPEKIIKTQEEIIALPYFFNVYNQLDLDFKWYINNEHQKNIKNNILKLNLKKPNYGAFFDYILLKVEIKNLSNPEEQVTKILKTKISF